MIRGKNIVIRQLEIGDELYLNKWWNDEELMEHATFPFGSMESRSATAAYVAEECSKRGMFSSSKRFIICEKEGMEPIGEMNYCGLDHRNQSCEIGVKICEIKEQGKGYGYDAVYHFIDFLFRHHNLVRIELTSMMDNKRAHNLYRKLGFKEIGVIRKAIFDSRTGKHSDALYMDLLKEEWEQIIKGN